MDVTELHQRPDESDSVRLAWAEGALPSRIEDGDL